MSPVAWGRGGEQSLDQSLNGTTARTIQFPQIRIGINQLPGRVCPGEIETEPFFKQRQREREPIDCNGRLSQHQRPQSSRQCRDPKVLEQPHAARGMVSGGCCSNTLAR